MKKVLYMLSAAVVMLMSSCSGGAEKSSAQQDESTTATVAEQPKSQAEINVEQGAAFIANLKANDSTVVVTPSGLAYKVVKEGQGAKPSMDDVVTVKYTGKHIDGSVFDSSGDNTIQFPLRGVIKGFSEGLINMNRGSIYELYIPGDLGYGPQGTPGGPIGPNETLIFELELVDF